MIGLSTKDKTIPKEFPTINSFGFMLVSICLITCFCYLARAASLDEFTRVEPCFSECSREMLQCQNYIVPLYHGKEFFDKPIFTYWLIILCYKLIGVSVFAARLPSVFGAVFCIAFTACFTRRVYGNFAGILSGAILASCIGFADMASTAMSDMPLCLFELISILALFWCFEDENKRTKLFGIASISMGLGFLTKSLIALVFPIATFVIFLLLYKKINIVGLKRLLLGLILFTAIVLPWHIALYKQCGTHAFTWMYLHEQIQRFSSNIVEYNFHHPFYYMTYSMVYQLLPWSLFLPIVIWKLVKDLKHNYIYREAQFSVMLLIFILLHILIFSVSKSNWGYYNLPALPAASILIGKYLSEWLTARSGLIEKFRSVIPISIFVGACIFSLVGSFFILPTKIENKAPHKFTEIITSNYPKNKIVVHMDLFAQYFLCDWVLFKTGQAPLYNYQNDMVKTLSEHKAVCAILPLKEFNDLPKSLTRKLQILATENFKFIPFPLSPLKTEDQTDNIVSLVLVTNQRTPIGSFADNYRTFEAGFSSEQAVVSHKAFPSIKPTDLFNSNQESKATEGLASWWLTKAYFAQKEAPDIVVLGSSQLGPLLGADSYVYNRAVDITGDHCSYVLEHDLQGLLDKHLGVLIGALPSAMISDQLIISQELFSDERKPKLVAITFSPRDFIDNCFPSATSTEAFNFFRKQSNSISLDNSSEKVLIKTGEPDPIYNYYSYDKSPVTLGEPFKNIRPGEIVIHSGDGYLLDNNIDEYRLRYQNPVSPRLKLQMQCFDDLLKFLAQQKIKVVVFGMPLTTANRKLLPAEFWSYYNNQISQKCKKYDADWIDIDTDVKGFNDKEFMDSVHLNLVGGHRLASTFALYIANKFHWRTFEQLQADEKKLL